MPKMTSQLWVSDSWGASIKLAFGDVPAANRPEVSGSYSDDGVLCVWHQDVWDLIKKAQQTARQNPSEVIFSAQFLPQLPPRFHHVGPHLRNLHGNSITLLSRAERQVRRRVKCPNDSFGDDFGMEDNEMCWLKCKQGYKRSIGIMDMAKISNSIKGLRNTGDTHMGTTYRGKKTRSRRN